MKSLATLIVALACVSPSAGAQFPTMERIAADVFQRLGAVTADCPAELLGAVRDDVEMRCASLDAKWKEFRRAWAETTSAETDPRALHPLRAGAWHRVRRFGRGGHFIHRDGAVLVLYRAETGVLAIARRDFVGECFADEAAADRASYGDPVATSTIPQKVHDVRPEYPVEARRERLPGAAYVATWIDEEGRVAKVCLVAAHPRGLGFEKAAMDAVSKWRYTPATRDGTPVPTVSTTVVEFHLDSADAPLPILFEKIFFQR